MEIKRRKSLTRQLSEKYGGKWTYIPFCGVWECKELNLHAIKYYQQGYDMGGNLNYIYVYGLETGTEKFYSQ